MAIVTELCPAGNLAARMKRLHPPSGPAVADIIQTLTEVASALVYLAQNHVVHGDLKPENVLVVESDVQARGWCIKLCDFGTSRVLDTFDAVLVRLQHTTSLSLPMFLSHWHHHD